MKLSYKIPIFTGISIIATIIVNIVALELFTKALLPDYQKELEAISAPGASAEQIQILARIGTLDDKKQEEYAKILAEISNLSASIKNVSDHPELYVTNSGALQNSEIFNIPEVKTSRISSRFSNIFSTIIHPSLVSSNSPEGRFLLQLLSKMLMTNIIWLIFILSIYFIWIKRIFASVEFITERLQKYIDTSEYTNIPYAYRDEFSPLISTINNLYKSLSIQESIRSNFLSDLSHEIRTPITALRCYLEAIEDGMMKLDTSTVPLVQSELSRLASITERIMEYENLTHDMLSDIHVERFDISETIRHTILEYEPTLQKKKQKIASSIEVGTFVRMDKSLLSQILHNIFSNFFKYAGEKTNLSILFSRTKEGWILSFIDNGIGIPEDELDYVKEKFYRVDKSRTRDADMSMGIGLSIVDRIAKLHGGYLELQNNYPHGLIVRVHMKR